MCRHPRVTIVNSLTHVCKNILIHMIYIHTYIHYIYIYIYREKYINIYIFFFFHDLPNELTIGHSMLDLRGPKDCTEDNQLNFL